MAAPGSVEGRDTGRGGFNGGRGGREGGRGGRQLGPSALWKTHRALETQDVGRQAGRTGLDGPSPPAPLGTLTKTHTQLHSLHSSLNPFLSAGQPSTLDQLFQCRGPKRTLLQVPETEFSGVHDRLFDRSLPQVRGCDGKQPLGRQTSFSCSSFLSGTHLSD